MGFIIELLGEFFAGIFFQATGAVFRFPFVYKKKKFSVLIKEEGSGHLGAAIVIVPIILVAIYFIYFG